MVIPMVQDVPGAVDQEECQDVAFFKLAWCWGTPA